jgi:hypothetical protein
VQLNQYEDQWYSASSSASGGSLFGISGSSQLSSDLAKDSSALSRDTRKLFSALFSEGVITVDNKVRTQLRSGAPAWQFDLAINPDSASAYHEQAQQIISESEADLSGNFISSSMSADELKDRLEKLKNNTDKLSVWVDQNSSRVRRVVVTSKLDQSKLKEFTEGDEQAAGLNSVNLKLDMGFSDYNDSVNVEAPENAQPLQSLFGMPSSGTMPGGSGMMPSGSGAGADSNVPAAVSN